MHRTRMTLATLALSGFLTAAAFAEAPDEEKEAMEVGGLLTVDGSNRFKDWENTPARMGSMEMSANVHVDSNMEGSITLLSEDDPEKISVDQAIGQWTLSAGKIIFGQQAFNFGLLSTRTISDPLMLDMTEFRQAGITGLVSRDAMTYGFGLSSMATGPDSLPAHDVCVILNADFAPEGQNTRLSFELSKERQAVDGAVNLTSGQVYLDAEAMWRWKDDDDVAKGGYSAGLAWQANRIFQAAARWDALGDEIDMFAQQVYSLGITVTPVEHVFGAGEVSFDQDGEAYFAVQMGLESTLKLPGFQRKTLTR